MFGFRRDSMLVSYCPKRSKLVILVISTLHFDDAIDPSTGDDQNPEMIMYTAAIAHLRQKR